MDKPILTRQDALAIGYIRYYTGKPCIHGHDSERYTNSRTCIECNSVRWKKRPEEKRREYWQNYYTEEVKNRKTEKARKRREINPFKPRKLRSERKARVRARDVSGSTEAHSRNWYCVDHIIPIAHPDVCGLHTFANLQIITSEENRKKGQHFDPTEHEFIAEKS
jgi:Na+-translocating ferredoxin:NAD+ oxidoreductase RnfC subunit